MNRFRRWAEKEYSLQQRLIALVPAGLLFAVLIPFLLAFVIPLLDRQLGWPPLSFGVLNLLVGVAFLIPGLIFAFWSIYAQLTRARGTPLPMLPTQELLVDGPFRLCRNPMTLGTILMYLGVSFLVGSVASIVFVLVLAILLVTYLKVIEEEELEARFGESYRAYKANTPFILPRISSKQGR